MDRVRLRVKTGKKVNVDRWLIYFMGIILILTITALLYAGYFREYTVSHKEGSFAFDPNTIMVSLDRWKSGVFISRTSLPDPDEITNDMAVHWDQADYISIAQATYKYLWRDSWVYWKIKEIYFRKECAQADQGAQQFSITLYNIVHRYEGDIRLVRTIGVRPFQDIVTWSEDERSPVREHWKWIDMAPIKLDEKAAFQLAEANGGIQARTAIGNRCYVYAQLIAKDSDVSWQIRYIAKDGSKGLDLWIDPITGKLDKR